MSNATLSGGVPVALLPAVARAAERLRAIRLYSPATHLHHGARVSPGSLTCALMLATANLLRALPEALAADGEALGAWRDAADAVSWAHVGLSLELAMMSPGPRACSDSKLRDAWRLNEADRQAPRAPEVDTE